MNRWTVVFLLGVCCIRCSGRAPFRPRDGSLPFIVYFSSRYRGLCVGTLVSRTSVLTSAVCVTSPIATVKDTRPINVVVGTTYRHPRRGIRVQVTKILLPRLKNISESRGYLMEKSAAILLLKRKVPDILTEVPPRGITIDWRGESTLKLQEECMVPGWHFFYKGDKIYPVHKFLLQRNIRVQFMNIVKKKLWCDALSIKFKNSLSSMGLHSMIETGACVCIRDVSLSDPDSLLSFFNFQPDRTAQPCHGMYGAPLICQSKVVALMMAPDAQWTNCTGHTNVMHLLSSVFLSKFMECASKLFEPEFHMGWNEMKKSVTENGDLEFDYIPEIYDKLASGSDSSSSDF